MNLARHPAMPTVARQLIVVAAVPCVAAALAAGSPPPASSIAGLPGLVPVEQGVADVEPLGLSFRRLEVDRRRPLGFDQVFRLPPAQPGAPARFARRSGAVTAVFTRSDYLPLEDGSGIAVIPPDTRFQIESDESAAAVPRPSPATPAHSAAARTADSRVLSSSQSNVDRRVPHAQVTTGHEIAPLASPPAAATQPGMLTDEQHRVARITTLLRRAAAADDVKPPDAEAQPTQSVDPAEPAAQ